MEKPCDSSAYSTLQDLTANRPTSICVTSRSVPKKKRRVIMIEEIERQEPMPKPKVDPETLAYLESLPKKKEEIEW